MNVYDLKSEYQEIQRLLDEESYEVDEKTGEVLNDNSETIKQLLAEVEGNIADKANSIAYLIKEAVNAQKILSDEVKRLNARKTMFANQEVRLKELLDYLLGGKKLKTDRFTISYRKSTSVSIVDESLIPAEFLNVKETITVDKKKIKEKLSDFEMIPGAALVIKNSIGVR